MCVCVCVCVCVSALVCVFKSISISIYVYMFVYIYLFIYLSICLKETPCSVVASVLNCNIVVSEFKLPSHSHVNIRTITIGEVVQSAGGGGC